MIEHLGVVISPERDKQFSEAAYKLMQKHYMQDTDASPQHAFARAAVAYSEGDLNFAQRIYDYASRGWFMFASPVLSNAPAPNESPSGLPISCFLTYVGDNLASLIDHNSEVAWLSVKGGGVGGHWSDVRPASDKAPGTIPFLKVVDSQMTAYQQGKTRKGSYSPYMDVSHPDIVEFIKMKDHTGGDIDRKCFNLFHAVNISDAFMQALVNGDDWELRCPNTGVVRSTMKALELWKLIIITRAKVGSPYLNFIDTANRYLPEAQKQLGLKIHGSNLCNEIHLATSEERTAVCCLSSVNLDKYDEWRGTTMIKDLVRLLDNVLQFFIDHAPDAMSKAKFSAMMERSIGLGAMGFHDYLQSKGIPWESEQASVENFRLFKEIQSEAIASTEQLCKEKGEAPDMAGTGRRNAHLLAIAPNANSSILCGCSPSIEPLRSNAYVQKIRIGNSLVKNRYLQKVLDEHGKDNMATWSRIINDDGSVQNLDFLTDQEKAVFKTAMEIDQNWVVEHAAKRQQFICQGQSVNLFFPAGAPAKYVSGVHINAWKSGLKGLYYYRTEAGKTGDKVGDKVERDALKDYEQENK